MAGIFLLAGMGFQIPASSLVISVNADGSQSMEVTRQLVRLDLWPNWLEIGCVHTDQARAANETLTPDLPDAEKYSALTSELHAGLVAITAFAFAFDGFYDTVSHELGDHPDQATWKKNRTSRDAQVAETLRYRLKLGPTFAADLRTVLRQLFGFRSRAVHPSSAFVDPNYRPQIDSGVHPDLVTFSGPHSVQCRALALELLERMLHRASHNAVKKADRGWIERGLAEVDRLSQQYRVPGDDQLAFSVGVPATP